MKPLILASSSPRRRRLLAEAGFQFTVETADYDEDMTLPLAPPELAQRLSRGKAQAVAAKHAHDPAVIIGADTFVSYRGRVIGKPGTPERARANLQLLSGHTHSVFTGYTIIDTATGRTVSRAVETKVHFRNLTAAEIHQYVATGEPLDKAGSYAIQGLGAALVDRIDGDHDNVIGLPLSAVKSLRDFL